MVRPEGFEPPAYWSVVSGRSQACADGDHGDCLGACSCWCHADDHAELLLSELIEHPCICWLDHERGDCPTGCRCDWCGPVNDDVLLRVELELAA